MNIVGIVADGLVQGLLYGLLALGIVLVYKGTRILNFAQPYFGLLTAYLAWWFTEKSSFPPFSWLPFERGSGGRFLIATLLALLLVGLNGWGLEHSIMRKLRNAPRLVSLVATIALAQGTAGLVLFLFERTDEQASEPKRLPLLFTGFIQIGDRDLKGVETMVLVVVPIICAGLAIWFVRSKFGVAIRAAAENADAARLLGISVNKVSAFTWIAGSVLAGIAGLLVAESRQTLDISLLSTGFLVRGLAAALVGGLTSLPGAIVGGIIVGVSESVLSDVFQTAGVAETVFFVLVLAILVFRPGGLFGAPEDTEDKVAFIPTLRQLPARLQGSLADRGTRWLGVVIALELSLFSLVTGPGTNDVLADMIVFAIVGVSLTVLMGYTGQISLGHWGLVGVGAFAMAGLYTRMGVPYLVALPLTVVAGMAVSLVIGLPALRIRGLYLAVATLAFNLAAEFFIFRSSFVGGGSAGVRVDPPRLGPFDLDSPTNRPLFFFSLIMLVLVVLVARNLGSSRTGRGFFGLRENEKAAATLGVGLTRYKLIAFAVSGGMAALAGALYATGVGSVQSRQFETAISLTLVAMVMIGGLGSINGAILGAFVVFALPDLVEFENRWIVPIGTGILLIVVITRARGGLAGLLQRMRGGVVTELDRIGSTSEPSSVPTAATSTAGG